MPEDLRGAPEDLCGAPEGLCGMPGCILDYSTVPVRRRAMHRPA